ncbi:MAG: YceI family protein [Anaerolineales bacterium]
MSRNRIFIGLACVAVLGALVLFAADATIFAPVILPTPTASAAPGSIPPIASGTDAPTPDPSVRVFHIDPSQSEVRYEVGETFFDENNRFAIAVGRTHGVSGDIFVNLERPAASRLGEIVIDVSQFTSDETRRDNFIRRSGLESARFPLARFVPTGIEGFPEELAAGEEVLFTVNGDLTVKDVTLPVDWSVTARQDADRITGTAETQILMSDFGVGPIRISFLMTEDAVHLVFDFVAVAAG